jgi:hypothetical protein
VYCNAPRLVPSGSRWGMACEQSLSHPLWCRICLAGDAHALTSSRKLNTPPTHHHQHQQQQQQQQPTADATAAAWDRLRKSQGSIVVHTSHAVGHTAQGRRLLDNTSVVANLLCTRGGINTEMISPSHHTNGRKKRGACRHTQRHPEINGIMESMSGTIC